MVKASKKLSARERFARNVRLIRRLREMSQEELAYQAAIYRSHITQIEKGSINISIDTMEKIAQALHSDVQDLLAKDLQLDQFR